MKSILTAALLLLSTPALAAKPLKPLSIEVFTASPAGFNVTSTIISGEKDAVLIDSQLTLSDAHRLTARLLESGKNLKTIFITHAHPDHYFGLEVVLAAFPKAQVVATSSVVKEIKELGPKKLAQWKPMYGSNLTSRFIVPKTLQGKTLELEGRQLQIKELGAGESEQAAVVYVPELKTLIAGDLAFNGIHLWLAEGRPDAWLKNLQDVRAVGAIDHVIAGHKLEARADDAKVLDANVEYIGSFKQIVAAAATPEAALQQLKQKYPDYGLEIIAKIATQAAVTSKK